MIAGVLEDALGEVQRALKRLADLLEQAREPGLARGIEIVDRVAGAVAVEVGE